MLVNSKLTVYHKGFDSNRKVETWTRFNYDKVWFHGSTRASVNKEYNDISEVNVRIPYEQNENVDISNFSLGDIIVPDELELDITTQQDLKGYNFYNIVGITDNTYGINTHIHLRGQ